MISSTSLRRLSTVGGVIAALALGVVSIRAASDWTAASAPLTVAPVSVSALQAQLSDEQTRSAALRQQFDALESQSNDLAAALGAAHARIDGDARHAKDLAAQLKTAKQRLARLDATIAAANRAAQARPASVTIVQATAPPASNAGGGEPGDDHEGDDHQGGGDD